jgi:hypothetical protein
MNGGDREERQEMNSSVIDKRTEEVPPQHHHQHLPRVLNATSDGCSDGSISESN